ncbi:hypothetical protein [Streptomyces atratus]|uniref:hypothetical protein n=1 Tax=Streptomyces atratus TaxID=1893 RepID=UPI00325091AF
MADFRAEAIEVYEVTRSSDTRGIIAALLHLAETITPASSDTPKADISSDWQNVALSYLQGKRYRAKTVDRMTEWLAEQGYDVDGKAVSRGMWELVESGHVEANTSNPQPQFSAVPDRG